MKELCLIENTNPLYLKSICTMAFFSCLMRPVPLIVSPDTLWFKLRPHGLIFLFIFTEFFEGYPELSKKMRYPELASAILFEILQLSNLIAQEQDRLLPK